MCARLLACPLCSQPGFLTLDALRTGLISVATRPLTCPVCNEVLLGIDKLTIHLFSHTINLNSSNSIELSKPASIVTSNNSSAINNLETGTVQDWNLSKIQIADSNKILQSHFNVHNNNLISPQIQQDSKNESLDVSLQDQQTNHVPQVTFLQDLIYGNKEILYRNQKIDSQKGSEQILQESVKVNYDTQQYPDQDVKHVNCVQNYPEIQYENVSTFKVWMQDQYYEHQNENLTKNVVEEKKSYDNKNTVTTSKFPNAKTASANVLSEKANSKNATENLSAISNKNLEHQEVLPHLKLIKTSSTNEKTERCNICGFYFPDHNILLLHKQLVHMIDEKDLNVVPENLLKNYSCHLCSKVFKMRGSLMVHMRVAHMGYNLGSLAKGGQIELILNENKYSCPTCGKKFKKEQHVMQHLKTHEAKQWECDVCNKMFTTKYFLKKHKRLHSGEMPYKCNICNKTFTFQQSYHKHRLYHKDDKPHTCTTCGRSFKELSTLHNHERIHTGEKPFACETCGKCFRQRVSYLVHRRIHTGIMPYKCTTCGKCFRYKVSQRTHKCPAQQTEKLQPENTTDQPPINLINTQNVTNDLSKTQKGFLKDGQSMLNIINNEENKYVLIINAEDQHIVTEEPNSEGVQASANKKQKLEELIMNNEDKEQRNAWKSGISNNPVLKQCIETSKTINSGNEENADFFSMVISPLENGLSSPTAEMEHLRVSSPTQKDIMRPYDTFRSTVHNMDIINTNMEQTFAGVNNNTNNLQTINEESLKQLLYSINEK
ncbi:zinc finger protein 12-like [Ceratina calcarata]|uniref:Zinc finger protein 12-like n=1 Tax=Ceratina calcarata TaxID=156304 RepID=A0AAJ7SC11_9HYME|nr:zinc finger protein 12-like [Ceratina calcarata]XP_026675150.1 zinc finger protein 12-like [Ceratina calcarata]